MEELVNKFIEEEEREHEKMDAFIREFGTTSELLLKERNKSLSELEFEGLLSNKARLEEACTIIMNERCSAVLLNKLPSKEKDPGSFTIPCDIGHLHIDNALADLGASISLMPYTMYEKLGLGEPKPTRISLELADRSIQYPRGILEDVLIKIDKFVLPIDFVILDMREDSRIPIILGRSFLAIARSMIDVFNKKITLRVGSEEVIFDVNQSMKKPNTEDDECYGIDDLDTVIQSAAQELLENKNLEDDIIRPNSENHRPDSKIPIRRINHINTPYPHETQKHKETLYEHHYSASIIKVDEKKPELKDLPSHLEYAYLKGDKSCPVIISSKLKGKEKTSLLQVLEKRKGAIAWKMSDIKGISPSFCTHKILMEESFKPAIQPQRRLNLKVQDVVKDEIVRFLPNSNRTKRSREDNLHLSLRDFCLQKDVVRIMQRSGFNIEIKDKKGAENLAADHLSRLENPNIGELAKEEIEDKFPDEHLMILKTKLNDEEPWYADYVNYVIGKVVPPE
ncbi:DNA-directed DNA polymerase [Tanacetum coccineum]|uniref:DNA-directed DNA polymerase n=1 Tax=Tanacetum coccineum TaxID=301880 RepID=A0ABQ5CRQ5_9ASTR